MEAAGERHLASLPVDVPSLHGKAEVRTRRISSVVCAINLRYHNRTVGPVNDFSSALLWKISDTDGASCNSDWHSRSGKSGNHECWRDGGKTQ
eukprot:CAMPEP_0194546076 /NCGR_PEP_ID=MMETSP0253-20130528/90124_1 /TAXON_ID=2966 /ORGANISM="Noctiluca scintillans" /LENGTH=92 /DNA_ID=CAMNT_0039393135 /DNA_START=226 /DNA_END=501 /DNA_ORIENTATION=-